MKLNTTTTLKSFWYFVAEVWILNFYLASISFATLNLYFVYWFNFANLKTIVLVLETWESRTLLCIFSERMPLSWFKVSFTLTITASVGNTIELNDLFQWNVHANEFFYQICRLFLTDCNFKRWNFFASFFLIFDKKCRPITFKWLVLFIAFTQVVFTEKVLLL